MNEIQSGKNRYANAFLLVLVVFITAIFLDVIRYFLMTILLAAIFSALAQPLFNQLTRLFRGRKGPASAVTLLILVILVVVPLSLVGGIVVTQALKVTESVGPWIQEQIQNPQQIAEQLTGIPGFGFLDPYHDEILTKLGQLVGATGNFVVTNLSSATKGTVTFFFQFFLLLYSMFYFMMDGQRILAKVLYYIPLPHSDEIRMVEKFVSVSRATLKGTLVIGVLQGGLAGIALAIAGIQGALFWATVMTILSIIPGVGTALVWVPAAGYLLFSGHVGMGVFLIIFCGLVVGSVDNFVRPWLVGKDTEMHDLLILFSTLGGLLYFGVVGIVVGPIIAALFVTIWEIYGVVFQDYLPPVGSFGPRDDK